MAPLLTCKKPTTHKVTPIYIYLCIYDLYVLYVYLFVYVCMQLYYVYEYIYTYTLKYLCIHIHKDLFLSIVDKGIAEKVGQNITSKWNNGGCNEFFVHQHIFFQSFWYRYLPFAIASQLNYMWKLDEKNIIFSFTLSYILLLLSVKYI